MFTCSNQVRSGKIHQNFEKEGGGSRLTYLLRVEDFWTSANQYPITGDFVKSGALSGDNNFRQIRV